MGSLRNPVGSLAPAVYWRRRVLVLLAVLAVLALVLYACSGSGSGKKNPIADGHSSPAASQSSVPTNGGSSTKAGASGGTSGAPSSGASGSSGGPGGGSASASGTNGSTGGTNGGTSGATGGTNGGPGTGPSGTTSGPGCQLSLSLATQSAYANGVDPQFTVAVVNKGTADCDVDVSPKSLVLNVYSGQDHVWSSADCGTGGKDLIGIAPGEVKTVTYTWNRTRSAQSCSANATPVNLGTYFGVVSLGPGSSPNVPAAQSQPKTFELKTGS